MNELNQKAIEAFEAARKNDGLVSPKEHQSLLKDLTLDDWKAIGQRFNNESNLYGVMKNPVIQETESEILVLNDEHKVREESILSGVKGFTTGLATTAGGFGAGWMIGAKLLDGWRPAKFIGLAVGALAGKYIYNNMNAEIKDIQAHAMPLRIKKDSLPQ